MAQRHEAGFYEERLAALVMAITALPAAWQETLGREFSAVKRIAADRWAFLLRIALLYAAGIGANNFLSAADQQKFRDDLNHILETVFPDREAALAAYLKLHGRFLDMEKRHPPDHRARYTVGCLLFGEWVLGEALHWKRIRPQDAPAVARVGSTIWQEFVNWFDEDFDPDTASVSRTAP